jgi:hypothetical protein
MSWLARDDDRIEALDANPLTCWAEGFVAFDALVVSRNA